MKLLAMHIAITVLSSAAVIAASPQDFELPELPAVEVQASPGQDAPVRPQGVSEVVVSEFMTVDIIAQNDFVTNILQKLAIQSRRNIISSTKSERLVSANLYGVPFEDALRALLIPNGLDFVEEGEFLYVYTVAELCEMNTGQYTMVTRIIPLDYLRPEEAEIYAGHMLTLWAPPSELSGTPRGQIVVTKDFREGGTALEGGGITETNSATQTDIFSPGVDEYDLRSAIVVTDLPEVVDRIEAFIEEMDTPPAQILVEATIIQTTLSEDNALGVDFALLGNENFTDYFTPYQSGASALGWLAEKDPLTGEANPKQLPNQNAYAMSSPGGFASGENTITAGYVGNIGVFLRALDQVTDVTVLSNPKVMALNRQLAKVFVGNRIGYYETTSQMGLQTSSLNFIDTGIVLLVRPFVMQDGRIRLELSPKVSNVVFRETIKGDIPDESIQTVTTDVLVPEGHTAVLGGLFAERVTRSKMQVPLLGDLPLVGDLFKGRSESTGTDELLFLIKPTVLEDKAVIAGGSDADEYIDDVRVGSRIGLLYWSRERHSARLNLEAERLMARGNTYGVRFRLRRSLGIKQHQPGVVRALERLDRQELWVKDTSYLNELIDEEFARRAEEEEEIESGE